MTFILAALLIVIFAVTAVMAKTRKVKRIALIGLILVLGALCGLFLLGYAHGAYYTGQVLWTSPWVWLPFFLLCFGMFAAITYLRKLNRVP